VVDRAGESSWQSKCESKNDNIDCSIRALLVDLCWIGGPPGRIGASLFYW
jgi:hypothetical protein